MGNRNGRKTRVAYDAPTRTRVMRRRLMAGRVVAAVTRGWRWAVTEVRHLVWPPTLRFLGGVVLALVAAGLFFTYVLGDPWWRDSNTTCHDNDLGCGLVIHVLGTGIVAALAFYVAFLGRETWTSFRWRRRAKRTPERLFTRLPPLGGVTGLAARQPVRRGWRRLKPRPKGSLQDLRLGSARSVADSVISRKRLVEEMADDLEAGGSPQILVGSTGSGKTMVLLKLVQRLADSGHIPITVSLLDAQTLNFEDEAQQAYVRALPNQTKEEAEKQWRWHRRGNRITIIVDDLEKAQKDSQKVAEALNEVARNGLRVVAASRPNGVPGEYRNGRVDLEPLDKDEVRKALLERVRQSSSNGHDSGDMDRIIDEIVNHAAIANTPYYLGISRVLADTGSLADIEVPLSADARIVLLDAYREDLATARSRADAGLDERTRRWVMDGLEPIAVARLGHDTKKLVTVTDIVKNKLGLDLEVPPIVSYGQRLGVLETRYDDVVRFGHPTTLAFFAACYLAREKDDEELWDTALKMIELGPAGLLAFVFATAKTRKPELSRKTCAFLLGRLDQPPANGSGNGNVNGDRPPMNPTERLLVLSTVLEIARSNGLWDELAGEMITHLALERDRGGLPREQVRLIEGIGTIRSPVVYDTLWGFITKSRDYLVRRVSMRVLLDAGHAAAKHILPEINTIMRQAKNFSARHHAPVDDDRALLFTNLSTVARILPSLILVCQDQAVADRLKRHQESLREYSRTLSEQRGLEASIADGLKQAAMRKPGRAPDELAIAMLDPERDRARFWYARVLVVQAIARRCVTGQCTEAARAVVKGAKSDEHPFVSATAQLCCQALKDSDWSRYIWDDMTLVAAGGNSRLTPEAKQLIGEMIITLNMNEHATADVRERFGAESRLPACLEFSLSRAEILGLAAPDPRCPFRRGDGCMCPYTYNPSEGDARRELSRAFCREQRLHAQRLRHSDIHAKALKEFWREMEHFARF